MFSAIPSPYVHNMHRSLISRVDHISSFIPISQICSDGDVVCSSCSPKSKSCPVDACSAPVNPPNNREANITLRTKVNRLLIRCSGAPFGCSWTGLLKDEPAHEKEVCFYLVQVLFSATDNLCFPSEVYTPIAPMST